MNTSFPSASPDFAAFLAGGKPSTNHSQLKGMLASLGGAKPNTARGAAAGKGFGEMLDAPAEPATGGKAATIATEVAPSVLAGDPTVSGAVTLQIKGMVGGCFQPVPSEDGEVAPGLTAEGEAQAELPTAEGESTDPILTGTESGTTEAPVTGTAGPKQEIAPGREIVREIKLLPGRGHSLRGHGWNHARIQHTGACGKSSVAPKMETPVVKVSPPAVGCSAPVANPVASVSPDAIVGLTIPLDFSASPSVSGDELVAAIPADPTVPNVASPSIPVESVAVLANRPVADQTFALADIPTVVPVDLALPVAATDESAVVPDTTVPAETVPVTPELRREVVETVAAMLTPFLTNLPVTQPDLVPAYSAAQAGDVLSAGSRVGSSLTVTVKIGEQSRFSFELPQASLSEAKTTGLLAATIPPDETEQRPVPAPAAFHLPANLARMTDEIQSMDFRVQLKAMIEAAWKQPDQPVAALPLTDVAVVAGQSAPALSAVVTEKIPEVQTEVVATEASQPVIETPAPATMPETAATPVEVMVKLPGFGVVTAQLLASDNAASALLKKLGLGLGRAEKTAGDAKPDRIAVGADNSSPEKTFLSPGMQSLKRELRNDGTDVAESDDTMPANFTSRRVTVDQLEFPPRYHGRELQPVFGQSQNFADVSETPAATTPAPVLAHRAVETILNVVDAQRQSSSNASSVNLHFKFGGDDLAVRVQMRGGEVLTQFLTDSAELRSALSKEWQTMAGQGGAAGLRLQDPVIVPASAGSSNNGFGSMAQGQNQARQHAQQQQQEHAAMAMPELHSFRRATAVAVPKADTTPRVSFAPSTSQHLTATA